MDVRAGEGGAGMRQDGLVFRFFLCATMVMAGFCAFSAGPALASCAGGGADVDLVATGRVEDVVASRTSSRIEVSVDGVSVGDRSMNGQILYIKSGSGTNVVSSVDVSFREGARYMLYLQRDGDGWTTNICLGTGEISGGGASAAPPAMPRTGGPGVLPLAAVAGILVFGAGMAWRWSR